MKITAKTTTTDIEVPIREARSHLFNLSANYDQDPTVLLAATHGLWAAIAVARLRREVRDCLAASLSCTEDEVKVRVMGVLIHALASPENDRFSDRIRSNDAVRYANAAARAEALNIRWDA